MSLEIAKSVVFDALKVDVSARSCGTVAGVQLTAEFQFLFVGSRFQVALPAKASGVVTIRRKQG